MRTPEIHLAAAAELCRRLGTYIPCDTTAADAGAGTGAGAGQIAAELGQHVVELPLATARDRITAAPIYARQPSPLFDNSQMDGYALSAAHLESLPGRLPVGPTVPAGTDPDALYPDGLQEQVAPVMTGSRLPAHTVAVIPVEKGQPDDFDAAAAAAGGVALSPTTPGAFVRRTGSDIQVGDTLLPAATRLTPVALAALASQNISSVPVWRQARVVLCTGGAEIGGTGPASIPDANGPLLQHLSHRYGIEVAAHVRTDDEVSALDAHLRAAVDEHRPDAIITSGGISHGKFEVIRQLLEPSGGWFGHVTQQPGGPQGLAEYRGVPVLCLPGNPVSTLVSFRLFVAPLLGSAAHVTPGPDFGGSTARLEEAARGLGDQREQFRRGVHYTDDSGQVRAQVLGGASSHLLAQASTATCLIRIPARCDLPAGSVVTIYPL